LRFLLSVLAVVGAVLHLQRLLESRQIEESYARVQSQADLAPNLIATGAAAIRFSDPRYSTNPSLNSGGSVGAALAF
jgi:hypothetical protein